MKICVFDSGIGGQAVANELASGIPESEIVVVNDRKNVPYGSKSKEDIVRLTKDAIQPFLGASCDVIVIACNTATALAIDDLREAYPDQKFVGLEPMIKPASEMTKTKVIGVCATPATLNSDRYKKLKDEYCKDIAVIEPDCSNWASLIEKDDISDDEISNVTEEMIDAGADVIVLACTHYHWISERISQIADGRAEVIEPSEAIQRRVVEVTSSKDS